MNAQKVRAFNFCPALQLQGRTFSFVVSQKVKQELQTRSLFVVVVVVLYDVRSIIYIYIPLSFMFI